MQVKKPAMEAAAQARRLSEDAAPAPIVAAPAGAANVAGTRGGNGGTGPRLTGWAYVDD